MNTTTSKLGADMLTDEEIFAIADDNDSGRAMSGRRLFSERNLLLFARALLARQPAAIDKQEAVTDAWESYLDEQKKIIGMPGLMARPSFFAGYKAGLAAPLANESSKPAPSVALNANQCSAAPSVALSSNAAPSVEQDERRASWAPERIWLQRGIGEQGSHTWCEDSIDDCEQAEYMRISRESCPTCHGNDSDLPCAFPEGGKPGCPRDIRLARAASTSANVAQGAERKP